MGTSRFSLRLLVEALRTPASLSLILLLTLTLTGALPSATAAQNGTRPQRALVPAGAAIDGGQVLEDYGAFKLVARAGTPTAQGSEMDIIHLNAGALNVHKGLPALPPALADTTTNGAGLRLIQFIGPPRQSWLRALLVAGVQIIAYIPNNAYLVWGDARTRQRLAQLAVSDSHINYEGPFHPYYKLDAKLADPRALSQMLGSAAVTVTVQIAQHPGDKATVATLTGLARQVIKPATSLGPYTNITLLVDQSKLTDIANLSDVVSVLPQPGYRVLDEVQGQILAGNLTAGGIQPSGPGYLAWLQSKGFGPSSFDFVVDVSDGGLDRGSTSPNRLHPDFLDANGHSRVAYNYQVQFTSIVSSTLDSGGHGTINAAIIAGLNTQGGFPYVDANGYHYGLGIAPFARVGASQIFNPYFTFPDYTALIGDAFASGARISSNSWGCSSVYFCGGRYDSDAQTYDNLVRNAQPGMSGDHPMTILFAAGNSGPYPGTSTSPATAKNIISVGAADNVRPGMTDGCGQKPDQATSAQDLASFSGRGPMQDGRAKPDLVAPGTHITGAAPQYSGFTGGEVCGLSGSPYYPPGQTLYTWSSGTSHSTPAAAGAAALVYDDYRRTFGTPPSPAMVKAWLTQSARVLTGAGVTQTLGASTLLPSNDQGWGEIDLNQAFDGVHRSIVDQQHLFTDSGQTYTWTGNIADSGHPTRVTLAWTDAPGSTVGDAFVNDLNLEVTVAGDTYKGNVFNSRNLSVLGGNHDSRNNVESVFLPAGVSGPMQVRVLAQTIAGDARLSGDYPADQDFALLVSNATAAPAPILAAEGVQIDDRSDGNGDGIPEPGETVNLSARLVNRGDAPWTGGAVALDGSVSGVTTLSGTQNMAALGVGASAPVSFRIQVPPDMACGQPLRLSLQPQNLPEIDLPKMNTFASDSMRIFTYTGGETAIPDLGTSTTHVTTSGLGNASGLTLTLSLLHTYDADLVGTLIAPDGISHTLFYRVGGSGHDMIDTTFDDSATRSISQGSAPFTGRYHPQERLSSFLSAPLDGSWSLKIQDVAYLDSGTLLSWQMGFDMLTCRAPGDKLLQGRSGWHLIGGTFGAPEAPGDVLASLAGSYDRVLTLVGGNWKEYRPGAAAPASTLSAISDTDGLWIHATSAFTLPLGEPAGDSRTLPAGWSLIAFPISLTTPIAGILGSVDGLYDEVLGYDAGSGAWQRYRPDVPAYANTLAEVSWGRGYYIHMRQAGTLIVKPRRFP